MVLWSFSNASWLHSLDGDGSGSRGIKSQGCSHLVAAPNHAHGTRLSAEVQTEASQSTTKVTKHSAATAGQLPLGTGGEFPVDQSRIFGTRELHRHVLPQRRLQSEVPSNSDLERHFVAVQETEQWVGFCLVPVRFRTYDEQLDALT